MQLDLALPVYGDVLPSEHRYLLYGGLTCLVPDFHIEEKKLRFAPINGDRGDRGLIRVVPKSRLRIRLPVDQVASILTLVGRTVSVGEHTIRLGNPTVLPLVPAPMLAAKLVTFKNAEEPGRFLEVAQERLREVGIDGEPGIPLTEKGKSAGEPRRQVLWIKGACIVGYALRVMGLTAEESIRLQEAGLGGRTRIGCGFFLPYRPRVS